MYLEIQTLIKIQLPMTLFCNWLDRKTENFYNVQITITLLRVTDPVPSRAPRLIGEKVPLRYPKNQKMVKKKMIAQIVLLRSKLTANDHADYQNLYQNNPRKIRSKCTVSIRAIRTYISHFYFIFMWWVSNFRAKALGKCNETFLLNNFMRKLAFQIFAPKF